MRNKGVPLDRENLVWAVSMDGRPLQGQEPEGGLDGESQILALVQLHPSLKAALGQTAPLQSSVSPPPVPVKRASCLTFQGQGSF